CARSERGHGRTIDAFARALVTAPQSRIDRTSRRGIPSWNDFRWRMCAMTASAGTLSIEETLLNPPALPPPPTRHALLVIVIALAALLHVVTIGTGDLYSETEGQYAGAAREMVASHNWLLPTNDGIPRLQNPPLLYW